MVKTQCRWLAFIILNDIAVVRSIEYLLPQVGQKRLDHFIYVIHDRVTGMQDVFNFFIMFFKDFLEYVHKAIMKEVE